MASVVRILVATRELGMTAQAIGMLRRHGGPAPYSPACTASASASAFGPGPTIVAGFAVSAVGWLALAVAPPACSVVLFDHADLLLGRRDADLRELLSLQAVTEPLLGRMTSTMRWLI